MRPADPHGQRLQHPLRVLITVIISHHSFVVKLEDACARAAGEMREVPKVRHRRSPPSPRATKQPS